MSKNDLSKLRAALSVLVSQGLMTKDEAWDKFTGAVDAPESKPQPTRKRALVSSHGRRRELTDRQRTKLNRAFASSARHRALIGATSLKNMAHRLGMSAQTVIAYGLATGRLVKRAPGDGMFYISDTKTAARRLLRDNPNMNGHQLADKLGTHFTTGYTLLRQLNTETKARR